MKFKVGDQVLVTSGKDKGKKGEITQVLPQQQAVVIKDVNVYVKHVKPVGDRSGERTKKERPLSTSKIAIINNKGQVDRIGYVVAKDGSKERVFKKTGKAIAVKKTTKK